MTLDEIKQPIGDHIPLFEQCLDRGMSSDHPFVSGIVSYINKHKGKQIRPILTLLSAAATGQVCSKTHHSAALMEMIHLASLVHDDIVDEAYQRHGNRSVNSLWGPKNAVLVGDYMLSRIFGIAFAHTSPQIQQTIARSIAQITEGELIQMECARKLNTTRQIYFSIIEKKTAALLVSSAVTGALSADAPQALVEAIEQYARCMGIAYQIKDDMLDYTRGDSLGKAPGNDIKERKITLPLIHALENAPLLRRRQVMSMIRTAGISPKNIEAVRRFVTEGGGIDHSAQVSQQYLDRAKEALAPLPDSACKRSLEGLADYVLARKK